MFALIAFFLYCMICIRQQRKLIDSLSPGILKLSAQIIPSADLLQQKKDF